MDSNKVPQLFRAQVEGRCQLQNPRTDDAQRWAYEWIAKADRRAPAFSRTVRQRRYRITWRFVTNGGQDDGVIRPVLGARGWPYYPGSSMKGAFRSACRQAAPDKVIRYCGGSDGQGGWRPGILRFHGGYPANADWQQRERLVDLVHPQEGVQVEASSSRHSAFALFSLYRPELRFALSSNKPLEDVEWTEIWSIWEKALSHGIGSRVSAGYGRVVREQDGERELLVADPLVSVHLTGQGQASYLLTKASPRPAKFRPNMFKAALRGHTRRLFGGFVDEATAEELTYELWGGIQGKAKAGLLGVVFNGEAELGTHGRGSFAVPTYTVKDGWLRVVQTRDIPDERCHELIKLVARLMQFSLLLGGFGKSWRRVDHRLFYPQYYTDSNKPLIGCHWKLSEKKLHPVYVTINDLQDVGKAIEKIRNQCHRWIMSHPNIKLREKPCHWREAWHADKVQVWGRVASDKADSRAVSWFHGPYQNQATIKGSELTGRLGAIGRIWHRMYPRVIREADHLVAKPEFVELLTLFPDSSQQTQRFINFLATPQSGFTKLWPFEE